MGTIQIILIHVLLAVYFIVRPNRLEKKYPGALMQSEIEGIEMETIMGEFKIAYSDLFLVFPFWLFALELLGALLFIKISGATLPEVTVATCAGILVFLFGYLRYFNSVELPFKTITNPLIKNTNSIMPAELKQGNHRFWRWFYEVSFRGDEGGNKLTQAKRLDIATDKTAAEIYSKDNQLFAFSAGRIICFVREDKGEWFGNYESDQQILQEILTSYNEVSPEEFVQMTWKEIISQLIDVQYRPANGGPAKTEKRLKIIAKCEENLNHRLEELQVPYTVKLLVMPQLLNEKLKEAISQNTILAEQQGAYLTELDLINKRVKRLRELGIDQRSIEMLLDLQGGEKQQKRYKLVQQGAKGNRPAEVFFEIESGKD